MTESNTADRELAAIRAALESEYEVLKELGRGGMAVVYRARDRELERDVAIKVLPFTLAMDDGVVERFQREARTSAQLEHPHIVPIYRVGRAGQVIYFVMQFLRGQTLGDRLLENGPLTAHEVRRLLREVGSALGYAASRGVVHRDIKPDNIMIDESGRAIVTDFGIARSASESRLTATGLSVGTPRYMSPEQARSKPMDGRSDLYSLGIVAYEALTGERPFDGDDPFAVLMAHVNTPPPTPRLITDEERAVYAIIERLIAKDPADRFQTAEEMLAALDGTSPVTQATPTPRPSAPRAREPLAATAPAESVRDEHLAANPAPKLSAAAAREMGERVVAETVARGTVARKWALSRSRGFWMKVAAAAAFAIFISTASHYAMSHRSRCPAASGSGSQNLTLLVDPVKPASTGDEIDVYYDVCGLPDDSKFSSTIHISRSQSTLKRFFGGSKVEPITEEYAMESGDDAERRHREVDLGSLPAGSYTIRVSIADDKGRTRSKSVPLEIRD